MILESAQLLSTAHRLLDGTETTVEKLVEGSSPPKYRKKKVWRLPDSRDSVVYSATHMNHPSAVWARASVENYNWLVDHFFALMDEYTHRYGKKHKCGGELAYVLSTPPHNLREYDATPMPCAMDESYVVSTDPVENYRNYYKLGKANLHKWTKRDKPEWLDA